jgi:hypothetical protein
MQSKQNQQQAKNNNQIENIDIIRRFNDYHDISIVNTLQMIYATEKTLEDNNYDLAILLKINILEEEIFLKQIKITSEFRENIAKLNNKDVKASLKKLKYPMSNKTEYLEHIDSLLSTAKYNFLNINNKRLLLIDKSSEKVLSIVEEFKVNASKVIEDLLTKNVNKEHILNALKLNNLSEKVKSRIDTEYNTMQSQDDLDEEMQLTLLMQDVQKNILQLNEIKDKLQYISTGITNIGNFIRELMKIDDSPKNIVLSTKYDSNFTTNKLISAPQDFQRMVENNNHYCIVALVKIHLLHKAIYSKELKILNPYINQLKESYKKYEDQLVALGIKDERSIDEMDDIDEKNEVIENDILSEINKIKAIGKKLFLTEKDFITAEKQINASKLIKDLLEKNFKKVSLNTELINALNLNNELKSRIEAIANNYNGQIQDLSIENLEASGQSIQEKKLKVIKPNIDDLSRLLVSEQEIYNKNLIILGDINQETDNIMNAILSVLSTDNKSDPDLYTALIKYQTIRIALAFKQVQLVDKHMDKIKTLSKEFFVAEEIVAKVFNMAYDLYTNETTAKANVEICQNDLDNMKQMLLKQFPFIETRVNAVKFSDAQNIVNKLFVSNIATEKLQEKLLDILDEYSSIKNVIQDVLKRNNEQTQDLDKRECHAGPSTDQNITNKSNYLEPQEIHDLIQKCLSNEGYDIVQPKKSAELEVEESKKAKTKKKKKNKKQKNKVDEESKTNVQEESKQQQKPQNWAKLIIIQEQEQSKTYSKDL